MKKETSIGWLIIVGAIGILIPYTILTSIFEYPLILREETGTILSKFHAGGSKLIAVWFSFAILGLPLLPAYVLIGQQLEHRFSLARVATTLGITGLIVQMIGLLRWTFVVPVIANSYVTATTASGQADAIIAFKTIHQFAGVLLGEHLGQLFTIAWTVMISVVLFKARLVSKWITVLGFVSSFIYILAQADLFATVIPGFPVWKLAGFAGSTAWLLWLITLGITFIRMNRAHRNKRIVQS